MIDEGVVAPTFELPALVDGTHRRVALADYLGEDVIILAFYPGDFNPACDEESDLDELDLFTMQKDVTVLGIGPDTLYAHEAFADAYDLHVPLLSDARLDVAETYDVVFEDDAGRTLVERAVFVVDHDGEIAYAWRTRDLEELPETESIKDAIGGTGGDETAFARYRVGHAHYVEGRRAFTSAMNAYGDSEWMIAQSDFQRAREEFTEADEHFDSAVRFVDDSLLEDHYLSAEEKATLLWQAADWLAQSASEYSSGEGAEGQRLRDDAERPLEEAKALVEPHDPDEWPPAEPPEDGDRDEPESFVTDADEDGPAAALDVDIDEESTDGGEGESDAAAESEKEGDDIDDEELAEIEAELAGVAADDPVDDPPEERRSVIDGPPGEGEDGSADDPPGDPDTLDTTDATGTAQPTSGAPRQQDGATANGDDAIESDPNEDADGPSDHDRGNDPAEITDDDLAEIGAEIAASGPTDGADDTPDGAGAGPDHGTDEDGDTTPKSANAGVTGPDAEVLTDDEVTGSNDLEGGEETADDAEETADDSGQPDDDTSETDIDAGETDDGAKKNADAGVPGNDNRPT